MSINPNWGIKRTCQGCGVRFYDLNKSPIVCPKCSTPYEIVVSGRGRRGRQAALDDAKLLSPLQDNVDFAEDLGDATADLIEDEDDLDSGLDDVVDGIDHEKEDDI